VTFRRFGLPRARRDSQVAVNTAPVRSDARIVDHTLISSGLGLCSRSRRGCLIPTPSRDRDRPVRCACSSFIARFGRGVPCYRVLAVLDGIHRRSITGGLFLVLFYCVPSRELKTDTLHADVVMVIRERPGLILLAIIMDPVAGQPAPATFPATAERSVRCRRAGVGALLTIATVVTTVVVDRSKTALLRSALPHGGSTPLPAMYGCGNQGVKSPGAHGIFRS